MLDSSQTLLIQLVVPVWYCSHGNRSKTALRACSSSGLENVSSLRLVFLLSPDDPGPWDPRDPVAVDPLLSKHVPRSCRVRTTGPRSCICFQRTDASHKTPNNLGNICNLSRLGGHCLSKRLDSIFDHLIDFLHRTGAKSCSFKVRKRTVRKTIFEEKAGAGDIGTLVPSLVLAMRKDGKLQNWVVDTWTRQNQKSS